MNFWLNADQILRYHSSLIFILMIFILMIIIQKEETEFKTKHLVGSFFVGSSMAFLYQ